MYALLHDALEEIEPAQLAADGLPALRQASARILSKISDATQLRHARYCGLSSAMGEIAIRRLITCVEGKRRAVLTASIDPHRATAEEFGRRLHEAGPRRLNPIMFPHTLPSATAVTLGAQFSAHTCAIAFDGSSALQDAIAMAGLLLRAGQADTALLFVCSGNAALGVANIDVELFGIGILLSGRPFSRRCLSIRRAEHCLQTVNDASNLFHQARLLTKLAIDIADLTSAVEDTNIAGHIFREHNGPSNGESR